MIIRRQDFQLEDKTVFGRLVFKPPFKASSALKDEARLMHVIHGSSRLYSPKHKYDLSTGDTIVMKCENFVNNWLPNENDIENEAIVIQLYPEILKIIYDDKIPAFFSAQYDLVSQPVEKIPANEMMKHFIAGLRYYFENPTFFSSALIKIKIQELLLVLVNTDNSGRIKAILGELFQTKEYEFKEIIRTHLFEDLKIEDLAFFAGLSLSSFKRKFKTVYGTSPSKYIKTRRLEKARNLLSTTNMRISEIAYDCGFNDIGYFSKSFHAAFDHSPSEYRKIHLT